MQIIKVVVLLLAIGLMASFDEAQARVSGPVVRCAAGGDFGNDGLIIELYPIRGNPDAFWAVHTEVTPGGGQEYMRVFVFLERTESSLGFSGGPLNLKLLIKEPKVKSVEDEMLTVSELETVNSFGRPEVFKKPKAGSENYEIFLCENRLK